MLLMGTNFAVREVLSAFQFISRRVLKKPLMTQCDRTDSLHDTYSSLKNIRSCPLFFSKFYVFCVRFRLKKSLMTQCDQTNSLKNIQSGPFKSFLRRSRNFECVFVYISKSSVENSYNSLGLDQQFARYSSFKIYEVTQWTIFQSFGSSECAF